jgi:isoquinoline 1-oxidoreductase alpha subunit
MTSMTVNGEALRFRLDPATPLLWALRDAANLTGAKHGCDSGDCGACTVIVDGRSAPSCTLAIGDLEGAEIVTIEGLSPARSHPVQQAWAAEQVSQCGFCEPGMIMALAALLGVNPRPGEAEIAAISNICRCGVGPDVRRAIARAAESMAGAASLDPIGRRDEAKNDPSLFSNGSSAVEQVPGQ